MQNIWATYGQRVEPHHPLQPLSPSSGVLRNFPEGGRLEKQSDLSVGSTIYSTNSEVRLWCQSQLRLFMLILGLTHWTVESVVDKSTLEVLNNLGSIYFPSTFMAIHKMSRHIFSLFSERLNEDLPQVPMELEPGSNVVSWLPLAEIVFINSDWTLHSLEPLHASRQLPGSRTEKGFVLFLQRILNV